MICRQCNELMVSISTSDGGYSVCKTCNNVDFSNLDLDSVVELGRD
jgi:hypothetical protein